MKPGEIIRLKNVSAVGDNGKIERKLIAPTGEVFVCILLGTELDNLEGQEGKALDPGKTLRQLGWYTDEV